jgi:competence CoiA-like predicted nuclease
LSENVQALSLYKQEPNRENHMSTKDRIIKAIAETPTPAAEPYKPVLKEKKDIVLHDLQVALSRANSLGIPVEKILILVGDEYTETHLVFLDEEEATQ